MIYSMLLLIMYVKIDIWSRPQTCCIASCPPT